MSNKVIVTGGAGYLGTHTTVALQNAGFEVVVVDNLINSDSTGVTKEFEEYARPLIIGELYPFIVDGLPRHLHLQDKHI